MSNVITEDRRVFCNKVGSVLTFLSRFMVLSSRYTVHWEISQSELSEKCVYFCSLLLSSKKIQKKNRHCGRQSFIFFFHFITCTNFRQIDVKIVINQLPKMSSEQDAPLLYSSCNAHTILLFPIYLNRTYPCFFA